MSPSLPDDVGRTNNQGYGTYGGNKLNATPIGIKILVVFGGLFTIFQLFLLFTQLQQSSLVAVPTIALKATLVVLGTGTLFGLVGLYILESWGWVLFLLTQTVVFVFALVTTTLFSALITAGIIGYVYSKRPLYRQFSRPS